MLFLNPLAPIQIFLLKLNEPIRVIVNKSWQVHHVSFEQVFRRRKPGQQYFFSRDGNPFISCNQI